MKKIIPKKKPAKKKTMFDDTIDYLKNQQIEKCKSELKKAKKKQVKPKKIPKKNGRPTKKDLLPDSIFEEMYRIGKTDKQVCKIVGISESTLNSWKSKNKKFLESLKEWKLEADRKVEQSLYGRANGFEYEEVKTEDISVGEDKVKGEKTTRTKKLIVPDVTAQIFWLKNRQPREWRDKIDHEHTGDLIINYGHRKKAKVDEKS